MSRQTKILTNAYNLELLVLAIGYFQNFCSEFELLECCSCEYSDKLEIPINAPPLAGCHLPPILGPWGGTSTVSP
jgi:hypothetical protein